MGMIRRGIGFGWSGVAALTGLVLPGECAGCGGPGGGFAGSAGGSPGRNSGRIPGSSPGNGYRGGSSGVCATCASVLTGRPFPVRLPQGRTGLQAVYALSRYQDPVSELVIAQKEHGRLDLARPLGRALATVVEAVLAETLFAGTVPGGAIPAETVLGRTVPAGAVQIDTASEEPVFLVPIPSSKAAERRRGQDPVLRMARVAAASLRRAGIRAEVLRALRHNRIVADQVGLSSRDRMANLAGSMSVGAAARRVLSGPSPGFTVLLDDVCTSGATLLEGARALRSIPGLDAPVRRPAAAVLAGPVR